MSENTQTPGVRPGFEKKQEVRRPANQYVMVKNYLGGLSITIDPHDFSMPARDFSFRFDVEKLYIPAKFALGIFVSPDALTMMERGYFTFENLQDLIKEAEDLGYYVPDSIKNPIVTTREIKALLRAGDVNNMERTLMNATSKTKSDVIDVARKIYSSLNVNVVQWIEEKYQVSLKTINLND